MKARFTNVGHLMGSAAIEVWITEEDKTVRVAFSGDLGRGDRPIINDPDIVEGADYLVMESTYGDRNHEVTTDAEKEAELASVLRAGIARGGQYRDPRLCGGPYPGAAVLYQADAYRRHGAGARTGAGVFG